MPVSAINFFVTGGKFPGRRKPECKNNEDPYRAADDREIRGILKITNTGGGELVIEN